MALQIGDRSATSGMTKAIYDQMHLELKDGLKGLEEDQKMLIRESWKKIAFAVATGVIDHIKDNIEIFGVACKGNVQTSVTGNTQGAPPNNHVHAVNFTGAQNDVVFTQSNDGVEHVK